MSSRSGPGVRRSGTRRKSRYGSISMSQPFSRRAPTRRRRDRDPAVCGGRTLAGAAAGPTGRRTPRWRRRRPPRRPPLRRRRWRNSRRALRRSAQGRLFRRNARAHVVFPRRVHRRARITPDEAYRSPGARTSRSTARAQHRAPAGLRRGIGPRRVHRRDVTRRRLPGAKGGDNPMLNELRSPQSVDEQRAGS